MSSMYDDEEGQEGVIRRRFVLCDSLQQIPPDGLIRTCGNCCQFFVLCCSCRHKYGIGGHEDDVTVCHHFRLIFTDGACRNNGQPGATAGIGVAMGTGWQYAVPITANMDRGQRRTSSRAELLAALSGLRLMVAADQLQQLKQLETSGPPTEERQSWVIATDSEYVVKGMTEWLPAWKNNKMRNGRNVKPANLDLFLQLDAALANEEMKGAKIGFWHVPREYNSMADTLAKQAAQLGDPE
ncbi:hypothetical protein XPA_004628 [Xanthoria parietina]